MKPLLLLPASAGRAICLSMLLLLSALSCLPAPAARAGTITVITSFPKELTDAYKKAFEFKHPDIRVEVQSIGTAAALRLIQTTRAGQRPEVLWASAPDAFESMARQKLLEKAPEVRNPAVPPRIGKYPMNDPDGMYYGQALSGYGIMWNKQYLQTHRLPAPADWTDLARPVYFGHIAMSSPARSGTTHLTVETLLQGYGWDQGWRHILRLAGNCSVITERSLDVPDGVNKGNFGIGVVIDFFGLSGKYSGFPVDFIYPHMTAVVPASIGLIAGAVNPSDAKKFIAFALSRTGQEVMLEPKISRIPVLPYGDLLDSVPGSYPNIFGIARRSQVRFDSNLAQQRHGVVATLFDQSVTLLLKELQTATKAIHSAEMKLGPHPGAAGAALLLQARERAYAPLLDERSLAGTELFKLFSGKAADTTTEIQRAAQLEKWLRTARANYAQAALLALQAANAKQ